MRTGDPENAGNVEPIRIRPGPTSYAFGDVGVASLRLWLLDSVFAVPTDLLIDEACSTPINLAVDLGCGPGYTTRRLGDRVRPVRLVGIDQSEAFLKEGALTMPSIEWLRHDVTQLPLPTGPADVLHARFVLSHLPQPESVLTSWLEQLRPKGYLFIQEDDRVQAEEPALLLYEDMARSLVTRRGGDLWVGARLAAVRPPQGYETIMNRVYPHPVPIAVAAQLFSMNFSVWRHDPLITENHAPKVLEELEQDLAMLATSNRPGDVVFEVRQLALRRR